MFAREGTELHLFQALKSASVPACLWVSSRWQAQLSFGQESAPLAGRGRGVECFSGNPVSSGAQGILRTAAKLLEMPASQGKSLFFSKENDGCGCVISPLPPVSFLNKGNGFLQGREGVKLPLQVLLSGLTCIFSPDSDNDLTQ